MSITKKYNNDVSSLVQAEQVRLLYSAMPISIVATVINSGILVVFQWDVISHFVLFIWLASLLIITVIRGFVTSAYNRNTRQEREDQRWLHYFAAGVVLSGLVWGGSAIWLFPDYSVGNQVLVAFVIAGMSAGASTSLSYQRSLIIIFLLLTLIPLSIRFFLLGDSISVAMGTMSLLFLIMMSMAGIRNNKNIVDNISLRIEANIHEKTIRESEEKYRHIFNSSPLGILHYNSNGVVTDFNENILELTGSTKQELHNLDLINDTKDKALVNAVHQSLFGDLCIYEGITKSFAGSNTTDVRVFFRGVHAKEGEINGGVAILEDISEDKKIQKLKDEFISTISHELRTPLTAIKGAVSLLKGGAVGEMSDSAHDMLDITIANTDRLLLLINDILDLDKIESGTMSFDMKPVNVMEFIEDAVNATKIYAAQYNVSFKISQRADDVYILGEQQRLMQVMYNLLSNAAKFSPEGSMVEVAAFLEKDDVVISVTDQGEGIPKDFQAKVFERFSQADSTNSRRTGGAGLGLSISQGIIEKHHGKIDFTSSTKGTTFRIKLKKYEYLSIGSDSD